MRHAMYAFVIFIFSAFLSGIVAAQTRVSDKDVESMMKNLSEDAKKFTPSFNSGIAKSSIRKTTRERESKELVKRFEQQTSGMLKNFKKSKKVDAEIQLVLDSAGKIDQLLKEVNLGDQTVSKWNRLYEDLSMVSKSLGISTAIDAK